MKGKLSLIIFSCSLIIVSVFGSSGAALAKKTELSKGQLKQVQEKYQLSDDAMSDFTPTQLYEMYNSTDEVRKEEKYFRFDPDLSDPTNTKKQKVTEISKEEAMFEVEKQNQKELQEALALKSDPGFEAQSSLRASVSSCGTSNGYDCVTDPSWLKLETWITQNTAKTGGKVSSRFQWLKSPNYTQTDVFAIGLNSHFSPIPGTESAVYKYDDAVGTTFEQNFTTATVRNAGGYGYNIPLQSCAVICWKNHRGYMEYQYQKSITNPTVVDAYSTYAHQQTTIAITPSFSIPLGGSISLASSTSFDIVYGHAQFKPW